MGEIIKNYVRARKEILRSSAENKRYIVDVELPQSIASGEDLAVLQLFIKRRYEIFEKFKLDHDWQKLKEDIELTITFFSHYYD